MSLRDDQRSLTRRKVVDAVLELVADGSLDELSVPAVARRSGVSVATIYRHFPNRDDLLAAAAAQPARQALEEVSSSAGDDDLAAFQARMWQQFASTVPLLRHQVASAAGREMRRARQERSRTMLAAYLDEHGVDPESSEGQRVSSLILLLSGSLGFLELHDRQGLDVDEALARSRWAVQTLIDATRDAPDDSKHIRRRP